MILNRLKSASCNVPTGPAESYLWTLYNRCRREHGQIVLVDKTARRPIGIYQVDERERLAQAIVSNPGCFIKVNLMNAEAITQRQVAKVQEQGYGWTVGNVAEVQSIVGIHLDIDAGKSDKYLTREQALVCVRSMPVISSAIVNTNGADGGFHVYWCLREPVLIDNEPDRDYWKSAAKRWQERLKQIAYEIGGKSIDSTANIDRVLRPVGSLRESGNRVLFHSFTDRYYTPEELYIEPSIDEIKAESQQSVKSLFNAVLGPVNSTGKPIQDYIDAAFITPAMLLAEAGYLQLRNPEEWQRPGAANPGRSLKIATQLGRSGINVFSGGDPLFSCDKGGSVGKYHSVDEMFVVIRHGGDWKAAARWCGQQISMSVSLSVNTEAITNA